MFLLRAKWQFYLKFCYKIVNSYVGLYVSINNNYKIEQVTYIKSKKQVTYIKWKKQVTYIK